MFGIHLDDKIALLEKACKPGAPLTDLQQAIIGIAYQYCEGQRPNKAMQVMRIANNMLFKRDPDAIRDIQAAVDQGLPKTAIPIPKFLRSLPLYSSRQQRFADEARDMLAQPMTADERAKMRQEAKKHVFASNHASQLRQAMHRINQPDYIN